MVLKRRLYDYPCFGQKLPFSKWYLFGKPATILARRRSFSHCIKCILNQHKERRLRKVSDLSRKH